VIRGATAGLHASTAGESFRGVKARETTCAVILQPLSPTRRGDADDANNSKTHGWHEDVQVHTVSDVPPRTRERLVRGLQQASVATLNHSMKHSARASGGQGACQQSKNGYLVPRPESGQTPNKESCVPGARWAKEIRSARHDR